MKKMLCMLLAAMLCFSTAYATVEYSLPEKWQRQVDFGNGVKGTLTINASGDAEWTQMLAPLQNMPLEIRAITSDDRFQYKLYALNGEEMVGLTQLYGDDQTIYLKSDLSDKLLCWHTGGDMLNTLAGTSGNNPALYSAMLNILSVPQTSWDGKWAPVLSAYESKIELWLEDYASAPSVKRDENGSATVLVRYDIPAEMVKAQIKELWGMLLEDAALLPLLKAQLTQEQQNAYLNANLMYYYQQVIDALPLTGAVVLEREMTAKGDILRTDMSFPLAYDTWTKLVVSQVGAATRLTLSGTEQEVVFSVEKNSSTPDSDGYKGEIRIVPCDADKQGIAIAFSMTEIRSNSVDADNRSHEVTTWNISLAQAEDAVGDRWATVNALDIFAKVHFHSKSMQYNAVGLEIDLVLNWADAQLSASISLSTRSPWVLDDLPTDGAVDASQFSGDELAGLLSEMGLNGLTMLMMNQVDDPATEEATSTDLQ